MIKIERYKNTRQWAVWMKDELVAVVCYKKGAHAIKQLLDRVRAQKSLNDANIKAS
jgi:hypothetical protein